MSFNSNSTLSQGVLFTDFYELTMAQLYFNKGLHENKVCFDYFFRNYPQYNGHKAGFCINAGLEWLLDWMDSSFFEEEHLEALSRQTTARGEKLFSDDFLKWLKDDFSFKDLEIKAVPEGRVVHPNVPILSVQGPLAPVQVLESSLLNHLNFQTLIATKAARIKDAARGQPVLEFGLRRAQYTGANAGVRAALIGGADFSSNTGASCQLGFPPKGTHAHSLVQVFIGLGFGELDSFRAYAETFPDDCLLLVDTVDTLRSGIPNAIKVFKELRAKGHEPIGIRLDSGDLAYLAIQAAKMLNEAGFEDAKIVLSNELDEIVIWQILTQIKKEARGSGLDAEKVSRRLIYGVGTRLITSKGSPALDGVYKLVAIDNGGSWEPALKLSEVSGKILNPGRKNVWRVYDKDLKAVCDLITMEGEDPSSLEELRLRHPVEDAVERNMHRDDISRIEPLLVDIRKGGRNVYTFPTIEDIRRTRRKDLEALHVGVKRLIMPHHYHVSISQELWRTKKDLIDSLKGENQS